MAQALYGMPSPVVFDDPNYIIMGCLMDDDMLQYACKECGTEVYESGRTAKPAKD